VRFRELYLHCFITNTPSDLINWTGKKRKKKEKAEAEKEVKKQTKAKAKKKRLDSTKWKMEI